MGKAGSRLRAPQSPSRADSPEPRAYNFTMAASQRVEHDPLGEVRVPANAY
jgi:hypothetical protein